MELENNKYDSIAEILKKASKISIKNDARTIFDVAGYPHYENVISNILSFFFNANEEHKFNDLWLKSLMECYNEIAKTNIQLDELEEIEREYFTEDQKRIDIIMSFANAVVVIENKIFAHVYNPFKSYHKEVEKYIRKNKKGDCNIVEILISLNKEDNKDGFKNITYEQLFERVEKNLPNYKLNANAKWLLYMEDFLKNIKNFNRGLSMNLEWQKLISENEESLKNFFENYTNDIKAKILFRDSLSELLKQEINNDITLKDKVEIGTYKGKNAESYSGYFSLYVNFLQKTGKMVLEPYISRKEPRYLTIELWDRTKNKTDWSKEKELLKNDYPDSEQVEDGSWKKCLRLENVDFAKNINVEEMAKKLLKIIKILASDT